MKIASFDIGIKNMAYCILQQEANYTYSLPYSIRDWKVLNLMEENQSPNRDQKNPTCTCRKYKETSKKSAKQEVCNKSATYFLESSPNSFLFFCKKHAIENTENKESTKQKYFMYSSKFSKSALTKLSIKDLTAFSNTYFPTESMQSSKKDTIEHLLQLLQGKCLMPIVVKKKAKAGDTDLVTIGRNMATLLDNERDHFADVTHIIIENQISTIAARMKTIQGMLAQYFILRNPGTMIQFVSSMNKLKGLDKLTTPSDKTNPNQTTAPSDKTNPNQTTTPSDKTNPNQTTTPSDKTNPNPNYKKHKKDGVEYCRRFLDQMPPPSSEPGEWKSLLENSKKKDDLADCFLQGIWYLQK